MRDLMMLGAMVFIVPIALANAFAAYLVWGWTSVISVPFYLYGFMGSLRYNLFFAVIALTLMFAGRIQNKGKFSLNATSVLMLLFLAHGGICAALAAPTAFNSTDIYIDLVKSFTYCLVMFFFVNTRLRLHAMLVAIALGLGFHGGIEGLKTLATGGGHIVLGIPSSKMGDNNHFGVAIVMVLPILLYLYQYSKLRLIRYGFLALTGFTALAVVGSESRGAFLAMALVGAAMVATSRHRIKASVLVGVAVILILVLSPAEWFERIESIGNAGEDRSFMGRVEAWNVATAVALKSPIFGSGFHAPQSWGVWGSVRPHEGLLSGFLPAGPVSPGPIAAHSIYFEVLGDQGFIGLFLFLGIGCTAFINAALTKRAARAQGPSMLWASDMADALRLALVAFAVGGAAVSLAYFETYYVVVVLLEVLKQHVVQQGRAALARPPAQLATG
ncbi:putative O-glycosylation ligase, exosortase A system-associated [Pseudorhodoferax sp. Leaf267]|uniref:putative O-glycosylation ligase, exosortase A system-associated n=1 Tax=Pseudorhodoferax sp. Leaf267 TaxID=1736316 RepID=UPI0006F54379|nr:putative O-glycosylation ligase, exosortase A system-associated [Pseudorhodoferax sp. Leaf267]KQP23149.1 hypothetical protein ASF43_04520 [Pseudorhodoferax sp. Leaf267]